VRVRPAPGCPSSGCRAGGRPEAARRDGLEVVEKVLTTQLNDPDLTERDASGGNRPASRSTRQTDADVGAVAGLCSSSPWSWWSSPSTGSGPAPRPRPRTTDRGAVSSRPCPQCPGRHTRCPLWTPHRPARSDRGHRHGRSAAAWRRRGPAPMVHFPARTATSRPRCPLSARLRSSARRSVRPGVRTAPAVSTRTGCAVSIRSGVRGLLAVLSAVCRRSDGLPCGQRTARTPQGTAVCGAALWPRYRKGSPARRPLLGCSQRRRARAT
jgi:hypothetical protein